MYKNGIIMQYFEWYLPDDSSLWRKAAKEAAALAEAGITAVWFPPAYKGQAGCHDVGYGVYDLYDLGEFDQKGSIPTKYGTKDEYLAAIDAMHKAGIAVYADIVLNHKMGAGGTEQVMAVEDNAGARGQAVSGAEDIEAWTRFTFPGRHGKYSDFTWNHTHFNGVDWDQEAKRTAIYNFVDSPWNAETDNENENYDYLMGCDVNFDNPEVLAELDRWGQWYLDMTGVDGFRLDAVKHIKFSFFANWLGRLRGNNKRELFAMGEYWRAEVPSLEHYLKECNGCMSLFDVPLHMHFFKICHSNGAFDMSKLLEGTLVGENPGKAVTFVENHDTQAGQALESIVEDWFKPLAYAFILLRPQGYPCVFYGDYYGVPSHGEPSFKEALDRMFRVRHERLYGPQHDYFDHFDIIGWTLEGDDEHPGSGVAVLLNDGPGGQKDMFVGTRHAGETFTDCTGNQKQEVVIREDGVGTFTVDGGSYSVWIGCTTKRTDKQ